MTISIDNAYIQTFENNVRHLAQQGDTRLRKYVTEKPVSSQYHNWDRLAAGSAVEKTSARTSTPQRDRAWTRRISTPSTWHDGETVEPEDIVQMLIDPQSPLTQNIAMSMARAMDDIIIAAATATASTEGGGTSAFPAGQTIGDGSGVMSLDYVLQIQELFEQNDVEPDEPKVMVIGPTQKRKLMGLMEVTSSDFQSAKALASGILPNWMGFTWIVSNRLTVPDTGEIYCLAFTKKAIGLQMNKDIWAKVAERPDQSFNIQLYSAFTAGAVRVEDEHIVCLHLLDAISAS